VQCVGGIGWQGVVKVGGSVLPFRSAQASEEIQITTPVGIGSRNTRYYNKFQLGKKTFKANVSFQLYQSYATASQWLINQAIGMCPFSASAGTLQISPAGNTVYTLPGVGGSAGIDSMSLSCVAGDGTGVQGNASFTATKLDQADGGLAANLEFETPGFTDDGNQTPWYSTDIIASGFGDSALINNYGIEWSLNITNEIYMRYGLCGTDDEKTIAQAVRYGMLDITGSIKYWSPTGAFSDSTDNDLSIRIDLSAFSITLNNLIVNNNVVPSSGPNAPVCKQLNFRALGNCDGGAPMVVS
jgi:hypothetical protein